MYKAILAVGATQAALITPFGQENLGNVLQAIMRRQGKGPVGATGVVTWAQCADDAGVFQFDESSTTVDPDPIHKATNLNLNLKGIVSDEMTLSNIHVHVLWAGTSLYDEDIPMANTYDSNFAYTVGWYVPGFAPSGHYDVTMTGTGSAVGVSGTVMCVNAQFDL